MEAQLQTTGWVFGVQPFSLDDGPGIRTTVFLKGCNATCLWCHNPESIAGGATLRFQSAKCIGCGKCVPACPLGLHTVADGNHLFSREGCTACGACAAVCPTGALTVVGEEKTVAQVLELVERDRRYYDRTGGGITISGGEPMFQPKFTLALLQAAKSVGLHTTMETNGFAPWSRYEEMSPYLDLVLLDLKATGTEKLKNLTGLAESPVLENIRRFGETDTKVVVRCPIIPDLNNTEEHFAHIAELSKLPHVLGYELMPYHNLGVIKAIQVGYPMEEYTKPTKEEKIKMESIVDSYGGRKWKGARP